MTQHAISSLPPSNMKQSGEKYQGKRVTLDEDSQHNFYNKSVNIEECNHSDYNRYLQAFPSSETALIKIVQCHMESSSKSIPDTSHCVTLLDMPGVFYKLVGDYLDQRTNNLIKTNRLSFKVALDYQIAYFKDLNYKAQQHKELILKTLQLIHDMKEQSEYTQSSEGED